MDLSGEYRIPAPKQKVWEALNDPEVLYQCIPGCESLEKVSDEELAAKMTAKVGPVKAKFSGTVTLSDIDAPNSYTLSGEGKGGAAGFGKGTAKVHLTEDNGETVLTYNADAQVGGKLAQLGARLIQGTARKYADDFFSSFSRIVAGKELPAEATTEAVPAPEPEQAPSPAPEPVPMPEPELEPAAAPASQPAPEAASEPAPEPTPTPASTEEEGTKGLPMAAWIIGVIAVVLALLLLFG